MMVLFDFDCNGQSFRVKREYAYLYGKPYTSLEFGIIENDAIIPLTDKTIRATQHKIEQTLHIDFDSFVNSAFLRQGQSNEFSKKLPKSAKRSSLPFLALINMSRFVNWLLKKVEASRRKKLLLLRFKRNINKN